MRTFRSLTLGWLLVFLLFSCQKEMSYEVARPAQGSLRQEASGNCLSKTIAGSYVAGKALTDSNFLEVEVDVSAPGAYAIRTDTVNGYFFQGSGQFTAAGVQRIKLSGSGTPVSEGLDDFLLYFDSSFCMVQVEVFPEGTPTGPATFTLEGSGGSCMDAQVSGTFAKEVVLTGASVVNIKVNVASAGTYSLSTDTVNGMYFSGSGTMAGTGVQVITLTAAGKPVNQGVYTFTVKAGSASCTFPVTVTATAPQEPAINNLFPLSEGSWWSYFYDSGSEDSILIKVTGVHTIGGKSYSRFEFFEGDDSYDTLHFRKEGDDYYQYGPVDYFSFIEFDAEQKGDILFLKEGMTKNTTWLSATFSGSAAGQSVKLRYRFTCTDADVSETVNGKAFTGVYKISIKPELSVLNQPFVHDQSEYVLYFAKGVGLIYENQSLNGQVDHEDQIGSWEVK